MTVTDSERTDDCESIDPDRLDVQQLRQAHDRNQVNFGVIEVSFDVHAVALDRDDIVNEGSHGHVIDGCDKLLAIVDHAHDLPAGITVARDASVYRAVATRLLSQLL